MARIRLNQEYRNKCANRIKAHLFSEDTQEKQKYLELKEKQIKMNDTTFEFAKSIIRRHYTEEDVEKAYYLQNKFENVSTIAKDSCFHFITWVRLRVEIIMTILSWKIKLLKDILILN